MFSNVSPMIKVTQRAEGGERGPARRKRKVEEEEEEERDRRRLFGERGFSGFSRREEIGEDKQPCDMGAAVKTGGKT